MGPPVVVLDPVILSEDLSFEQGLELFDGEQLVAQLRVERFDERVLNRHQSRSAFAVSSGPLSQWMKRGEVWRARTSPSRTPTVASASIERRTTMARASLVNSSVMFKNFSTFPLAVWSNW